jgi:hypothetical protein
MDVQLRTVSGVLVEIAAAIEQVRSVAYAEQDSRREHAADWFDEQFAGVTTRHGVRAASKVARSMWAGAGSFSDVGTAASADAVDGLMVALRRGQSWFLREG